MDNATWVDTAVKAAYKGLAIGQPGGFGGQDATSGLQTGAFGVANAFTNFKDETYTQLVQAAGIGDRPGQAQAALLADQRLDSGSVVHDERQFVSRGVGCFWQGPRRTAGAYRRRTDSGGRLVGLVEHTEGARVKLGFWTLYDVAWTNEEIAQRAAALGYQGVDLRVTSPGKTPGIGENLTLDSSDEDIARTRSAFDRADVEISSLNCYNTTARRQAMPRRMPLSKRRSSPTPNWPANWERAVFGSRSLKGRPRVCPGRAISSTSGGLLAERWMASPT